MLKIYIILFFVFVSNNLHSQYYLELKKASKIKSFKFFPGEKIRFKLKDDENFTQGYITGISEDKLRFNYIEVSVSDIEIVDIRNKSSNFFKSGGKYIAGGSIAFFIIDFVNLSLVQKVKYKDVYNKDLLIGCSLSFSVGALLTFVKRKYFIKKKLNRIWVQKSL